MNDSKIPVSLPVSPCTETGETGTVPVGETTTAAHGGGAE